MQLCAALDSILIVYFRNLIIADGPKKKALLNFISNFSLVVQLFLGGGKKFSVQETLKQHLKAAMKFPGILEGKIGPKCG